MRGNSYAMGATESGASMNHGPGAAEFAQGWLIRVASIWDHLEPGLPA